jgi:hypothetical protein
MSWRYKLKSTSSVRGSVFSLFPLFPAPPLGSLFGFKSRTVAGRFFSVGLGSLVSSGMLKSLQTYFARDPLKARNFRQSYAPAESLPPGPNIRAEAR